jgi:hypothetical protein
VVSHFSDGCHIGDQEAAVTQSFTRGFVVICFALGTATIVGAQEVALQPVPSLAPSAPLRPDAIGESRVTQPIETRSHQADISAAGSAGLEMSPDNLHTPKTDQWQQGRRKRWGALIPLMALGALLLIGWLITPAT